MSRLARTLAAASLVVTAVAAAPARADRGCDHDRAPRAVVVVETHGPRAYPPPPPPAREWRRARHELRDDFRDLERARDRFYATWNGRPGPQRRFERWYASRRAELEARRDRLALHGEWRRW